jgi:hypothetical protein
MKWEFKDGNGNSMSQEEWLDWNKRLRIEHYKQKANAGVAGMKCAIHSQEATLQFEVNDSPEGTHIKIIAQACCLEFKELVEAQGYRSGATE